MSWLLSLLPPIPLLSNWKSILIALAIGLASGFYAGWTVKTKFVESDQFQAQKKAVKLVEESTKESTKIEKKNIDQKAKIQIKYRTKYKEVIKYVPQTVTTECKDDSGNVVPTTLNIHAVRMLNDEYTHEDLQSAHGWNAEVATPTEVGLQELSEYIVTIKQQYEELAVDHDALVEYNTWYMENVDGE